jgi:ArsR family transcriptional regulator, arsenate/arsenite/antimonite-responsive transcriptional repressor
MKAASIVKALGALAQESRLAVFRLLVKRGPAGYTPGELAEKLTLPAPTLSFHLRELQHAQLVVSRRAGRFLYYSANFATMNSVLSFLSENCCSLSDDCDAPCSPAAARKRRRTA